MRIELYLPSDLATALKKFRDSEPIEMELTDAVMLLLRDHLIGLGFLPHYEPPEDPGELH